MHHTFVVARCAHVNCRQRDGTRSVVSGGDLRWQQRCALMYLIQIEHVVGRCQHHLLAARQDHRLQHIDHLCDVCHVHALGVALENIQREPCDYRITQCVLLIEIRRLLRVLGPPGTPFAEGQRDSLLRIVLVEDCGVALNHLVGARGAQHRIRPLARAESERRTLLSPVVAGERVEVNRHHVDLRLTADVRELGRVHERSSVSVQRLVEECLAPIVIVGVCVGGNQLTSRRTQRAHIHAIDIGVVTGGHVAAATPGFVADADERHFVRLAAPIGSALGTECRFGRLGHVLQPIARFAWSSCRHVDGEKRLRADLLEKVHELVRAECVGFRLIAPRAVHIAGALLARTDAVAPMVELCETAARPTHQRDFDLAQGGDDITANAAHVGDRRILADPDTFIHAATEMLDELPIDVGVDTRTGLVRRHGDSGIDRVCSPHARRCEDQSGCQ